jgi:hypothetical protein
MTGGRTSPEPPRGQAAAGSARAQAAAVLTLLIRKGGIAGSQGVVRRGGMVSRGGRVTAAAGCRSLAEQQPGGSERRG